MCATPTWLGRRKAVAAVLVPMNFINGKRVRIFSFIKLLTE